MNSFHFEGVGSMNGGEYDKITIEGVGSCSESIKAKDIRIEGVFNCSGEVEAEYFSCEGVGNFKSNIHAQKITCEGVITLKQESKLEGEEIYCEGVIKSNGEISADYLKAEGCIEAKEIVGDEIMIDSYSHIRGLFNFWKKRYSKIGLIEATKINLSGVTADNVNGNDIVIGPYCKIGNIDCNGTLSIDKSSSIGNITGHYTSREY